MVITHKDLIESECLQMLIDDKGIDLCNMYLLLKRIQEGLATMITIFQTFIINTGVEAIKLIISQKNENDKKSKKGDTKDNVEIEKLYVEAILIVYNKFLNLVQQSFKNEPLFVSAMDKALRKYINDNPISRGNTKSPEYLAKYSDLLLKKGNKLDENLLEVKLGQIILIFKYIDDKDVFQKFYSKLLSRRLINSLSNSEESEKFMINGLREGCGYEYTSKLQRMFGDIQLAGELNESFKNFLNDRSKKLNIDFNVLVLTSGSWPLQGPSSNFILPKALNLAVDEFSKFYEIQHQGRKLNWLHNLCKADLKIEIANKRYEVQTTSYQMGVLILFNNSSSMSLNDIQTFTSLSDSELKESIKSLVFYNIIKRTSQGSNEFEGAEVYEINESFISKRKKFKITTALQSENEKSSVQTRKVIEDDRKLYLQATIVRVMKSRKVLRHNLLIQEVIEQSKARFQPSIPLIKKCVEQLIEKEYIERLENDEYSYVA